MDFKCFMKLLIEKGYIKPLRKYDLESEIEDGYIAIDYECKYKEVKLKIMQEIDDWHKADYLHNVQYQTTNGVGDDEIKIFFEDKLEHHIFNLLCDEEEKRIYKEDIGYIWLETALKYSEHYSATFNSTTGIWTVTDLYKKKMRKEKEKKEKEECWEFLRQLP